MTYLVSGTAGFIGYFVSKRLLEEGHTVIGIDSINDYYSVELKKTRLNELQNKAKFKFFKASIEDEAVLEEIFSTENIEIVINLAAQAGVRYSITNPKVYGTSNLIGFLNILEACRKWKVKHLVFASSSSVYGMNKKVPYCETDFVDNPVSLYAATKKANELMAHSYSHLYGIPCTGLRFFTVYGPMGRPDMAYFKFAKKIMADETIQVYNNGDMLRDFTYIDDIVEAVIALSKLAPEEKKEDDNVKAPFEIYNIGNESPEKLLDFISLLEKHLGKEAKKEFLPMQAGDVYMTSADTSKLYKKIGWKPSTKLDTGLKKFADWFLDFHSC